MLSVSERQTLADLQDMAATHRDVRKVVLIWAGMLGILLHPNFSTEARAKLFCHEPILNTFSTPLYASLVGWRTFKSVIR